MDDDTLAVLATGVGKSAIYEPFDGTAARRPDFVVVSPLIALQRDQLAGLKTAVDVVAIASQLGGAPAAGDRKSLDQLSRPDRRPDFVFLAPGTTREPRRPPASGRASTGAPRC